MRFVAIVGGCTIFAAACAPPDPAAFEAELLAIDRAFNTAVQDRGSDGWISFFAEDGSFIQAGAGEIRGTDAIRASMLGLDDPSLSLQWEPERAYGSDDGTLGYTVGSFLSTAVSGTDTLESRGRYVTIWRRQPDGSLRVVMDLGNPVDP